MAPERTGQIPAPRGPAEIDAPPPSKSVHGPLLLPESYGGEWKGLVSRMRELQGGDAPGALRHPEIGPIDVIWGERATDTSPGFGLAKIVQKHPEVVDTLPEQIAASTVRSRSPNRVVLETPDRKAVIRMDYDGAAKQWLMTAYDKEGRGQLRGGDTTGRSANYRADTSSAPPLTELNIASSRPEIEPFEPGPLADAQTAMLEPDLQGFEDLMLPVDEGPNGPVMKPLSDALEEARKGEALAALIEGCVTS